MHPSQGLGGGTVFPEEFLSVGNEMAESNHEDLVRTRILDWASPNFPLEIRDQAARVYVDYRAGVRNDETDAFSGKLAFGTGGMRGVLGIGPGRLNQWTVGRAALGFVRYIKETYHNPSIVIAHDSRRMSPEFAKVVAGLAAGMGVKAFLFKGVTPTPILSYAVRHLGAAGGAVLTASHNPPEYNGFKVYLDDGSQFTGDAQVRLEQLIDEISDWDLPFRTEGSEDFKKFTQWIGPEIQEAYYNEFQKRGLAKHVDAKFKIVFSPLHGTAGPWLPPLLEKFGYQVIGVPEQMEPDGEFPTVELPNPEEADALRLCEETARKHDAELFLATDPDADRLGAGIKSGNRYILLNGNQLGSIMCAFLCENAPKKTDKNYWIFKTIVTTDLQKVIAEKNGIKIKDVLTGFKYIAEQMRELDNGTSGFQKGKDVFLFGGEESYGYLPVEFVRDKDSLSSALVLCQIIQQMGNLETYLNQIYLKYGLYLEDLKSVTMKGSDGQQRMNQIIDSLRENDMVGMELENRTVVEVRDFKKQTVNKKPAPEFFGDLPPSNVIQLLLEPEGKLTIRPSGTEPKVKLYASLKYPDQPQSLEELNKARAELENELVSISGLFFARTGLTR